MHQRFKDPDSMYFKAVNYSWGAHHASGLLLLNQCTPLLIAEPWSACLDHKKAASPPCGVNSFAYIKSQRLHALSMCPCWKGNGEFNHVQWIQMFVLNMGRFSRMTAAPPPSLHSTNASAAPARQMTASQTAWLKPGASNHFQGKPQAIFLTVIKLQDWNKTNQVDYLQSTLSSRSGIKK